MGSFYAEENDTDLYGKKQDSLSYHLVAPLINTNTSMTYNSGYSFDEPLSYWDKPNKNLPFPRGFHLDHSTGDISFRPMNEEVAQIAVKVIEWREINGVMTNIGEVTRDLVYFIINCSSPVNTPPIFSTSNVFHVCADDSINYLIKTGDYDQNDTVYFIIKDLPSIVTWEDNNGQARLPMASITLKPNIKDIRPEPYTFLVSITDSSCPIVGRTSRLHSIYVHAPPEAEIKIDKLACNQFRLNADNIKEVASLKWYVNNLLVSSLIQGIFKVNSPGRIPIRLELTGYGCTEYVYDTLDIPYLIKAHLPADTILCKGDSINLTPGISGAQGNVSYLWSTGDTTPTLQIGPLYQDTLITLYVEDSMFCHSDTLRIKVDQFDVVLSQDKVVCPGFPAVLLASPLFDEGQQVKTYFWKDLSCGCPKGIDDSLTIYQTGVFTCLLENANGCRATDTISAIYHKTPLLSLYAIPDKCLNEADFPLDSFADPKGGVWRAQDTVVVLNNAFLLSKAEVKPYMLFYDYTDSITTCSNSASITFTVKKVPDIMLLSPLSYCDEDRLIDLSAHVSPQNGYWDTLHPAIVNAHYFNPHLAALVSNPLSYQVDSTNGCSNLLLIDYIINPMPEADFTADSLQGQSPLTVQFTNLSVISEGNLHYLWYFGDGDSSVLEDPSHVFLNTGQYDVRLIAVSDSLCRAERTKSKFIEVFASL
ncbi:MAG: PKD domain-containing protein, partial [Patescibacteria group bacterium]